MRTRGQDALKQLAADGQNTIELGCGEGRMKEEPNAIRHASLAQLCTSKKQEARRGTDRRVRLRNLQHT